MKISDEKLSTGAKIKMVFNELYSDFNNPKFKATSNYSDDDINRAILLH